MNDKCTIILNSIEGLDSFLQTKSTNIKSDFKNDQELFDNNQIKLAIEYHMIIETPSKVLFSKLN
jgi:hypothetical protein